MKIAGELTIKDWKDLEEKLAPNNDELWSLAFHFFEERIRTRYLTPINAILDLKLNNGEGFAVVNLQCSLIETIESFINGWVYFNDGDKKTSGWYNKIVKVENKIQKFGSQYIFESFFKNHNAFKLIDGTKFYFFVRCACLHETQTKNNWMIRSDKEQINLVFKDENGKKIIFRENFQKELENIIANYKDAIIHRTPLNNITSGTELRENFKAKMKHICDKSVNK